MEMTFNGEFKLAMRKERVFEIFSNPELVIPLIPNVQRFEMTGRDCAEVKFLVGIGVIRGTATTDLKLLSAMPPNAATYLAKGTVMHGSYRITAAFELDDTNTGTLVRWRTETTLAGKILSLAGGGLRSYAEKEIERTIKSLETSLTRDSKPGKAKGKWYQRPFGKDAVARQEQQPQPLSAAARELAPYSEDMIEAHDERRSAIANALNVTRRNQKLGRKEDDRLVRGAGLFVDDYSPGGLLHMALVRSPYAHAKIAGIDVSKAEAMPGVVCTLTGTEVTKLSKPFMQIGPDPSARINDYCLAVDEVKYQGEPVVAVIADSPNAAADAALAVTVEYEPRDVVVDLEEAVAGKVILHDQVGTNITWQGRYEYGDVEAAFDEAKYIVKIDRLKFHRFSSTPLEASAVVACWDRRGELDILCNVIMSIPITMIAAALGLTTDMIRLRTHDVGGSFGTKNGNYPYITLACIASRKANGAPVKWVETRSEQMQTSGHGAERLFLDTEVALDEEGIITGIRSRHIDDCGAYPRYEPMGCVVWSQVMPGAYKVRNFQIDFSQAMTNRAPCSPNRGYSRLQHLWFIERVIDICGYEIGLPSDEIRMRNFISELPYTTPNGCVYDSGDFAQMLSKGKEVINWSNWQREQERARAEGRLIGLGIGTAIDSGTCSFSQGRIINPDLPFSGNSQVAIVKLDLDGSINVAIGSFPQGQGHETAASQVVAQELGISDDRVHVKIGFDSARNTVTGTCGTYASQFAVTGLSAVHGALVKLKKEMTILAAHLLEADEGDLEFGQGENGPELRVRGTDKAVDYPTLANLVNFNTSMLPESLQDLTLNIRHVYMAPLGSVDVEKRYGNLTLTYAIQVHFAVVEVDKETAEVKIHDYAIVDDCGTVINKMIVEGQIHGAAAHGIGAAILETMPYDTEGNVVCGSFTDYVPITTLNMPDLKSVSFESPSPFTYNGAKGVGEGGGAPLHTIGAALQNALYEEGHIIDNSHNSRTALFEMMNSNKRTHVVCEKRS